MAAVFNIPVLGGGGGSGEDGLSAISSLFGGGAPESGKGGPAAAGGEGALRGWRAAGHRRRWTQFLDQNSPRWCARCTSQ